MRAGAGAGKREEGGALAPRPPPQRVATISHATNYHEKTTLLSSDDEFQWASISIKTSPRPAPQTQRYEVLSTLTQHYKVYFLLWINTFLH